MYRKTKSDQVIEPMPRKQLQRIIKAFKRNGGSILMNEEVDCHLQNMKAEGSTLNALTILLRCNPSRAVVFEELIHSYQYRIGKMDGSYMSKLFCEIEAQQKLIKYARFYNLTEKEIEQTRNALEEYLKELHDYEKGGK